MLRGLRCFENFPSDHSGSSFGPNWALMLLLKATKEWEKGVPAKRAFFTCWMHQYTLAFFFPILFFSKVLIIKNPNPLREVNNKYSHCAHLFFLSQLHSEPLESTFFVKIQLQTKMPFKRTCNGCIVKSKVKKNVCMCALALHFLMGCTSKLQHCYLIFIFLKNNLNGAETMHTLFWKWNIKLC